MMKSSFLASSALMSLAAFGLALIPTASRAQTATAAATQTETVIVTAQKREEDIQTVPVPVSVVSATKLTENGQLLMRDYYNSVPSLSIQSDIVNEQEISIRGISTGGTQNPTVGITVDGVPFRGGGSWLPDLDPGDLQRVEVLRGPQGTLYGANSMGGLVNFVTVDPSTQAFSGRVQAGYSNVSNGAQPGFNIRGSANVPLTDDLAVRVSAYSRQDPGYIDNPFLGQSGVNEAQAYGFRGAGLWNPTDAISIRFNAMYQNYKQDAGSEVVEAPGLGPWDQNYIAHYGAANSKTAQLYSVIANVKLDSMTLTSVTGYSDAYAYSTLDFGYNSFFATGVQGMFGANTGAPYLDKNDLKKISQELRLAGSFWKVDWLFGGFYTREANVFSDGVYGSDPFTGTIKGLFYPFDQNTKRDSEEYAGFANLTIHATDQFDIQLGGRLSHLSLDTPSFSVTGGIFGSTPFVNPQGLAHSTVFTYLVAPEYKISPDLMVYGRFSSGFRPGSSNVATSLTVNIPKQINPDQTTNYEIGTKGSFFDNMLTIDASAYYINWKNIQISLQENGLLFGANGSAAKSEGVELAATLRPFEGLTLDGWVAYDDAVLTEPFPATSTTTAKAGDRLASTPRWSANLSATEQFPLWSAVGFVGGDLSYLGDRRGNFSDGITPRSLFPAFTKLDLRAGVMMDSWTANIYVTNATNARGIVGGGVGFDPPNAFVYITPRTVGINLINTF